MLPTADKNRLRLGELLASAGLISEQQLEKALGAQRKSGERLGKTLINLGFISEENILKTLEQQLGVGRVNLIQYPIDRDAALLIPATLAERHQVLPIRKEGRRLILAASDPTNFFAVDDVRMVTGLDIEVVITSESDLQRAIANTYGVRDIVERAVTKLQAEDLAIAAEIQTADDAPIINIVNGLISQAVRDRASDIHIEPLELAVRVRFRVDGVLREVITFPRVTQNAIVSRIKIMADMDIAEKRLPQDGRIKVQEKGRDIDIRASTLPTVLGEKVVLRILDRAAVVLDISSLGFSGPNLERYKKMYSQSYGMILVTGPTGSGKTTTLYSTLVEIGSPEKNIITIEDPVEYMLAGVNQILVNPKSGLTFASGLRSILRQDPNVIMVGEVRDGETADIAVRAALTGHLVFSTLHTNNATGAISRLVDMGVEPFLVASSVLGVIAQRLVRIICPNCKEAYRPAAGSPERLFLEVSREEGGECLPELAGQSDLVLHRGKGCPRCSGTGYRGRMTINEVMPMSAALQEAVARRAMGREIFRIAAEEGMMSMRQDGIIKALQGLTTVDEVMRVAYSGV
ncbi:MAG TPA: ATPase, T2SS/T4P/T4SS family [Selenomonadales bacterium]|nr:ATPase, T2SS/T4P/T4SS family [Selenomonadales bacterium]